MFLSRTASRQAITPDMNPIAEASLCALLDAITAVLRG